MSNIIKYQLTEQLIITFRDASLKNADLLLKEANILISNGFYARAYFLACAAIEETGKAFLLFNAQSRNLKDGGIQKVIKDRIESHRFKISASFHAWSFRSILPEEDKEKLNQVISFAISIKNSREPSMYVDIDNNNNVISPSEIVSLDNATDLIKLSATCLEQTNLYIQETTPEKTTTHDDKFYCMPQPLIDEIMSLEDFSKYMTDNMSKGFNFAKIITVYHESYFKRKRIYT